MLSFVVHVHPRKTIKTCTSHSPTETLVHQADGHMMKNMLAPKDRSCERVPVSQSIRFWNQIMLRVLTEQRFVS